MQQEEKFRDYLISRFGITFPEYVQFEGDNSIRVMNSELKNFKSSTPKGIPASRMKGVYPKPSTALIQLFGNIATKNTIELNKQETLTYLQGKDISKNSANSETGYVILKYKNAVLGCGFYKEGKIGNLLPKQRRISIQ